jgi:hypothetical protein
MNYYINIFECEDQSLSQVSPDIHTSNISAIEEIDDYHIDNGLKTFRYTYTLKFDDTKNIHIINLA